MNEPHTPSAMQRVLIAMDSPAALSLLPAAAELAAQFQAELLGLFIEDTDLLRLSGLPFAQEVCSSSAVARPLTREAVERRLRALADELRQSLEETARRAEVRWSFVVARGTMQRLTEESARESDVLLLPQRVPAAEPSRRESFVWLGLWPIAVVYDGSAAARRALAIAWQAAARQGRVVFVILTQDGIPPETQRLDVCRAAPEQGVEVRFASERVANERDLRQVMLRQPCSLLLLPASASWLRGSAVARLVAEISPLVAIVR